MATQFVYKPWVRIVDEMQAYYPEGLSQRQLIAGTFLTLLTEHLHVTVNSVNSSAEATLSLLSSWTDQTLFIGSLVCYRALHLQSRAMSIETAQVWMQSEYSFISIYVLAPDEENFWRELVNEMIVF